MVTKTCTKCKRELPADRFSKGRSRKDGLQPHCKDCLNAAQRDWYQRNRERHASKMREWSAMNPERVQEYSRRSYLRNKDKVYEGVRRRRNERPEIRVVYRANGKAREVGVPGRIDVSEWIELKRRYGNKCLRCGVCEPNVVLSIDHIIPLSAGGPNVIGNVQPLCVQCNCKKGRSTTDYRPKEAHKTNALV